MITVQREVVVWCDSCTKTLIYHTVGYKGAVAAARQEGWSIGKTVKCPECRKVKR